MANLPQLVPINLAFLTTTMALDFDLSVLVRSGRVFRLAGHRRVQLEQMALSFAFTETLSPAAKRPAFVPSQFVERGSVLLL